MNTPLQGLHEQIIRQRKEGVPVREIAELYGVSRQAVYDVLKKAERLGETIPRERRPRELRPCVVCGESFLPKTPKTKTCSQKCTRTLLSTFRRNPQAKWSRHQTVELTCHRCGKTFQRTRYQQSISMVRANPKKRDFCSRECYHKEMKRASAREPTPSVSGASAERA